MAQFKRKGMIVWLLAYFLIPGIALSQEAYVLYEGDLIKAKFRCEKDGLKGNEESYKGRVLALKGNYLHVNLLASNEHRLIPWNCVNKWWKGHENDTRSKVPLILSGLVGGGLGFGFGMAIVNSGDSGSFGSLELTTPVGTTLLGIFTGAAIGKAMFGPSNIRYKWKRIHNRKIMVEPKIQNGTFGMGIHK